MVVVPKPKVQVVPRLPVLVAGTNTRTVDVSDVTGKHRFKVTLAASNTVDARVLDYLAKTLHIAELTQANRADLAAWAKHAGPNAPGYDITVTLAAQDGSRVDDFFALPPDGVELIKPGVLRVRDDLATKLAAKRDFKFNPIVLHPLGGPPPPPAPDGMALHGTLQCTAPGTINPLKFVTLQVSNTKVTTDINGNFEIPGQFRAGSFTIDVTYDGVVTANGASTPLRVMAEFGDARGDSVKQSANVQGGQLTFGTVNIATVDCEIWRLGEVALEDYHTAVGTPPPAGSLRIKRWAGVWDGTPYTFYDYIVLSTNWGTAGFYSGPGSRRSAIFHEFGHSIRHVADGNEAHWNWDNFRWAYARNHSGCETFNTQYAFNEGWAEFWAVARGASSVPSCAGKAPAFVDWTESMITSRLNDLWNALPGTADARARRMVQVLTANPNQIHSLREFEVKYCSANPSTPQCNGAVPRRADPASCPPGFIDDGATCRLNNILAKESYGRGVGTIPTGCGAGRELDAGLCYPTCNSGYAGVGPVCWQSCPGGYRDDGAYCAKPEAYGRGAGYPWQFGDAPFSLDGAKQRCVRDNPSGCEQSGLLYYPRCRSGFHAVGCCICSPDCPVNMADIGVSCQKNNYGRGVGTIPSSCAGGKEYDAGLCYTPCRSGFTGVGPVCWASACPAGYTDHGATCYRDPAIIVKY